ncbi:MAG: aminopeptidase N [Methylobacterium sp.]|uniref:aminopeptidase N n=1 Tax=Methylobacterium sp. TaxID=409 RepID=UPI0025D8DF75|nr:aminopeptidase N [Methylobacterium sp.]MBX9932783.1 aminopeptidase N [Methylobacterium sp.]
MRTDTPSPIRLEDYRPSDFLIDRVSLDVALHPTETRVLAVLSLRPNPEGRAEAPLILDGEDLVLTGLDLDGQPLAPDSHEVDSASLTILHPPQGPFTLRIATRINPSANTKLMGLYRSNGVYCTQCEVDGFRRITYFLDRPDVMAVYITRLEAELDEAPVLLGNGNRVEAGMAGPVRHYAVWQDPHPKPAYLFALVGGRLDKVERRFTTMEGRDVELAVYVEPGKADRATYALDAVARSMIWDEEAFGRAYDLDVFNVVAVSDFNMGAMENKGLNIFNDKFVLASPETATDADYANIEAIIAHEYFHNWSGNRVTCRDWFQLCLKEGLTVFRDQEFSSDTRSRPVHRIAEVRTLRARQFPEDAGPLRHPVRPRQYAEINNFYTATVYEKGAEIVRMLRTLSGEPAFRAGMDLYFAKNDGRAATVEDFLDAFAETTGRDLSAFARWYDRPGTPTLSAEGHYDAAARTYHLDLRQSLAGPPGPPLVIPIAIGLVGRDGPLDHAQSERIADGVFVLESVSDSLIFHDVDDEPVPSLLRGFSAPVKLSFAATTDQNLTLLRHDPDPFNRWQAAQGIALHLVVARTRGSDVSEETEAFVTAMAAFLDAEALADPAFAATMASLPSEGDIANEIGFEVNPQAIHEARAALRRQMGQDLAPRLRALRDALAEPPGTPFSADAAAAGRRALRNLALDLIAAGDPDTGAALAAEQFGHATTMTDMLAALSTLAPIPGQPREATLTAFASRFRSDPLVLDKWFALQATIPEEETLSRIAALKADPAFTMTNPNRVRALIGSFSLANPTQFHRPDGQGYALVAGVVKDLDAINPQLAARLLTAFGSWRSLEPGRRAVAKSTLDRLREENLRSRDVADILGRTLIEEPTL